MNGSRRKWVRNVAVAATLLATAYFAWPSIKTFYQRNKAETLVETLAENTQALTERSQRAHAVVNENPYLTPDERHALEEEIEDTLEHRTDLETEVQQARQLLTLQKYNKVRTRLSDSYDLPRGQTRTTAIHVSEQELADMQRVLDACKEKKALRDTAWLNERVLKVRLKKPLKGVEVPADLGIVSGKRFLDEIPLSTPRLERRLAQLPVSLYNSMGVRLIEHEHLVQHLRDVAVRPAVMEKAEEFYASAQGHYTQVQALNDLLSWYRPSMDGTLTFKQLSGLIGQQDVPLSHIRQGDGDLQELTAYLHDLHEQRYAIVTARKQKKYDGECEDTYDDEGNVDGEDCDSDYCVYWVVRQTHTAQGTSPPVEERLGQRDTDILNRCKDWTYEPFQQVGFVTDYKELHDDRIRAGMGLEPKIVELSDACKQF